MASDWEELMAGVRQRRLDSDYAHMRIHYTADQEKDTDWVRSRSAKYGGVESPKWRREMEIDYTAVQGQPVYPMLCGEHRRLQSASGCAVYRIIDHGIRHPMVCLWVAVNKHGDRHVFREYYRSGATVPVNSSEVLRMSLERVAATFIDPATRQRIPLSTKDNKPVSVISLYNNGLGCVCKPADNSSVGYDTVRNGLLSTLARRVLLDGHVDPESDFCKTYFDKYQLTTYELEQLAKHPALTFDPACHRVYTEMRNLRFKEVSGDATTKAQPEEVMDFEDDGPDCYSADTEVLTDSGWKLFCDLNKKDRVMTVNLKTDTLEYQKPTEYFEREYVGDMIKLSNQKGEFLVTPNHRMVVYSHCKTGRNLKPKIILAKDLKKTHTLKLVSTWNGINRKKIFGEDAGDFAEFLGWYISEGCCCINDTKIPNRGYQVTISQKKDTATYERIYELCSHFRWKWYRCKTGVCASSKELWDYLKPFGNRAWKKKIPDIIKESSPEIIERFLESYCSGDGWIHKGHRYWATTSKDAADGLQELIIKCGKSASIREREEGIWNIAGQSGKKRRQYSLGERSQTGFGLSARWGHGGIEKVSYCGSVYCVSVPNKTLVIRRKGSPLIAGNCVRYGMQSKLKWTTHVDAEKNSPYWEIEQKKLKGNRYVQRYI